MISYGSPAAGLAWIAAYRAFLDGYEAAVDALQRKAREVEFPEGGILPACLAFGVAP